MPTYRVYYAKMLWFPLDDSRPSFNVEELDRTHVFVREVEAVSKGDVYRQMQGEVWSPNGEARPLIERLGLTHTSMSVGDLVQDEDGVYWECMPLGWEKLPIKAQREER